MIKNLLRLARRPSVVVPALVIAVAAVALTGAATADGGVLPVEASPTTTTTATAAPTEVDAWPVIEDKCTEDDPCFNPCTMGVNGLYPETDARYAQPGPCDLYTPLPHGRRFAIMITPESAPTGVVCASDGWGFTRVQVWVRESDGTNVSGAAVSEAGCADAPRALLATVTPRLYQQAGALA